MPVPAVTLRLSGPAPTERLHNWARALAHVSADRRLLDVPDLGAAPDGLADWLRDAGAQLADGGSPGARPDVLIVAAAAALPSPTSLRRLVAAAAGTSEVLGTRVLPHGAVRAADEAPHPAPHLCVAVPAGAPPACLRATTPDEAVAAAGTDVRRLEAAAVFVGRTGDAADAGETVSAQPYGHPGALASTALHRLLLATGVAPPALPADLEPRPFLSVVTRTQGTRVQCLEEVLTCLAAQTSRDFEVVLAAHRVSPDGLTAVRRVLDDVPAWLAERIRLLEVGRAGRSAPLNDALDVARGRYVVVLDDDDAVTEDWVAAFAALEAERPGVVLRSVALALEVRPVSVDDEDGPRGPVPVETGPARSVWADEFRMVDHLWDNASPPMTFAVPRGVFADLGHRFDESLDTTEDWDFLMRAAGITGVASTRAITASYRVWTDTEGSRHLHDAAEWAEGRAAVLAGLDRRMILLEPGAARGIRDLRAALDAETAEKYRFARLNEQAASDLVVVNEAVVALRQRITLLEARLARRRRRSQPD